MSTISKANVVDGNIVYAQDLLNAIDALDGSATASVSIIVNADLSQVGNVTDSASSIAFGQTTEATGPYSFAQGFSTQATGQFSTAAGNATVASGQSAYAAGHLTVSSGDYSSATGESSTASGIASSAEGNGTLASGDYSKAIGNLTQATGTASSAAGESTTASGIASDAKGLSTVASGNYSSAKGNSTQATGLYSSAKGISAIATGEGSNAEGFDTFASGSYSHVEGQNTITYSAGSHAEGSGTIVGLLTGYLTAGIVLGVIKLDGTYGDTSGDYGSDQYLYINDSNYDNTYGVTNLPISYSIWDGFNTTIYLYDTSFQTTTAVVGNITLGALAWSGDQLVDSQFSHTEGNQSIALGTNSHAEGNGTVSAGINSHAEGLDTKALGNASHAEGRVTQAIGNFSHAAGVGTIALGEGQFVAGQYNITSSNPGAFIIGSGNGSTPVNLIYASGSQVDVTGSLGISGSISITGSFDISGSLAFPTLQPALDLNNVVIYDSASGQLTYTSSIALAGVAAPGGTTSDIQFNNGSGFSGSSNFKFINNSSSLQQGTGNIAFGYYSHAEGNGNTAYSSASHAEGISTRVGTISAYFATIGTPGTVVLSSSYGNVTSSYNNGEYLYINDVDYDNNLITIATQIDSSSFNGTETEICLIDTTLTTTTAVVGNLTTGVNSWAGDQIAEATAAHTEGSNTRALGIYSHAEGSNTIASSNFASARGKGTKAFGESSHAEGVSSYAIGNNSHAEGESTISQGQASHAEGISTLSVAYYSHAEGESTISRGPASHAEGFNTISSGSYSHAEGAYSVAYGQGSHAEGYGSQTIGDYSHAVGLGTIASGSYQTVVGQYNTEGDENSRFIVGNGIISSRKDAFKVTWSGSIALPQTQSAAPTWTGVDGEIVPATVGGVYRLYMWMNGAWRSSSFA